MIFEHKYIVLKIEDCKSEYLTTSDREALGVILHKISFFRSLDKKKDNTYIVVNLDDPKAKEILKIMDIEAPTDL